MRRAQTTIPYQDCLIERSMRAASAPAALLIIRAESAPAAPATAAAAHSAAHLLWPRGLALLRARAPQGRSTLNKGQFHVTFLENGHKLGCHNNQYRN
jgi:hypothetical protein